MKKYGLIGKSLSHSWSPKWFAEKFTRQGIHDAEYRLYEMDSVENLRQWAVANNIEGFNVTIPFKEQVVGSMDQLDPEATAIGAVNCVECRDGMLIGHNTDAPAFAKTLSPLLSPAHTHALVLGTGGASKAVGYSLSRLGIAYTLVSRYPSCHLGAVSYQQAEQLSKTHLIIVNTTPVGMFPNIGQNPWPYPQALSPRHLCYDLVYNPAPTAFLIMAAEAGAQVFDGLAMLHTQAELSWQWWNNGCVNV